MYVLWVLLIVNNFGDIGGSFSVACTRFENCSREFEDLRGKGRSVGSAPPLLLTLTPRLSLLSGKTDYVTNRKRGRMSPRRGSDAL
jgi:hypothetical protein